MLSRTVLPLGAALIVLAMPAAFGQGYTEAWRLGGLSMPESASYDPGTNSLFISNINSPDFSPNGMGYISQVGLDGTLIAEKFVDGLNTPVGTDVRDGTLWVVSGGLVEIDIATASVVNTYTAEGAAFLNDVYAADDGRVFVTDVFGAAVFVLENGTFSLWVQDPALMGANGITVVGNTVYVARVGDVSGGFENMVPNGNIKTIDLTTKAIGDFASANGIGGLDGIEPMGDGFTVTDNPAGKLLSVAADGTVTDLAAPGGGAADHEYVESGQLAVIPMLNTGELIAFSAGSADTAAAPAATQTASASVLDGVFTEEQVARGLDVYKANCIGCHAASLRGTPGAPGIIGSRFNKWVGKTVADLYAFVHENMPAGMGGTLQDQQYIDVVSYILSKAKYPAGATTELPADPAALAGIAIVAAP